ncbi:kinase-like domain-containing protein [Desarmillaria tabescens]|uniref:non-specific serine/threonine protein kinase n=1 Tax=Armillaria tabescens TaxID=1929756 RepID=A0AA39MQF5_ARMTA|nr:kinase-like domain-containing protein [Desarmillaria tabescens]KAK0442473.1 kinase-like domain-containing protein [Desarmillaria tabescens]
MLSSIRRFLTSKLPGKSTSTPQVLLHPAREGDVLNNQYSITRGLGEGFGTRSTIWLSKDAVTGHDVVLKITGADSTDAGKYSQLEVSFLQKVREARGANEQQHVIRMLDNFSLSSSFGTHSCLVLEVLSMSLEELTRKTLPNKFPIPMCKQIIKQLLLGLDFLHRECGIVHTDLKLDNLLLRMEDTKGISLPGASESPAIDLSRVSLGPSAVVISDLGVASKIESPFNGVIRPYASRAPEIYLGIPYGPPADIWNLGCLVRSNVFSRDVLLALQSPATSRWSRDDDMSGQMLSVNGLTTFSVDVLARGRFSLPVFRHHRPGKFLKYNIIPTDLRTMVQTRFPLNPEDEPDLFADMLSRMLRLRPEDRESAKELLSHPWLQDV